MTTPFLVISSVEETEEAKTEACSVALADFQCSITTISLRTWEDSVTAHLTSQASQAAPQQEGLELGECPSL